MFVLQRIPSKKVKNKSTEWENNTRKSYTYKEIVSRIYKKYLQLNKINKTFKMSKGF